MATEIENGATLREVRAADGGPKSLGSVIQRLYEELQPYSPEWRVTILEATAVLLQGERAFVAEPNDQLENVPPPMRVDERVQESSRVAGAIALAYENSGVI